MRKLKEEVARFKVDLGGVLAGIPYNRDVEAAGGPRIRQAREAGPPKEEPDDATEEVRGVLADMGQEERDRLARSRELPSDPTGSLKTFISIFCTAPVAGAEMDSPESPSPRPCVVRNISCVAFPTLDQCSGIKAGGCISENTDSKRK